MDGIKTNSLIGCSNGPLSYRSFSLTWSAAMQISWNKRRFLHEKSFQSPQHFLGTFNMAAVSLLWYTNMAAVKSCENDL